MQTFAGIVGLIIGYIGWYATFRLAGPLARLLTAEWKWVRLFWNRAKVFFFRYIGSLITVTGGVFPWAMVAEAR
jgi:hypothetical protein